MSCRDACPTGAVRFDLALGGARPRIISDACTGCGDCFQACPANAIELSVVEEGS
ncbi:4Fe-4S dicluster domain-containing protein [Microvirga lupini]|uniref:4Fe-4S dicluster domain-containing protein n=1 Tax=Microvirga lupini TaxID=420324 RepID=UPI001FE3150D|nr:4Fe-4S binding protein [Microvirga lupini]